MMFVQASLCFAQYQVPAYLNDTIFSSIGRYLKDSINRLDPIEGIYNVQMKRDFKYTGCSGEGSNNFSFRCAIYRDTERSFRMVLESFNGDLKIVKSKVTRIGETQLYSINVEYPQKFFKERYNRRETCYFNSEDKISAGVRVALESNTILNFNIKIKANGFISFDKSKSSHYAYSAHIIIDDNYSLIKEYPTSSTIDAKPSTQEKSLWTGTGFALANGYVVTNHHVIDEAKTISIKGVNGDLNNSYSAEVVITDKTNDIAVLKINDNRFEGFDMIPYAISTKMADVGEEVFVLGYPLTQALGNEIKLTNGIISSRTGYQGDIATYQISAPVQPGNSGGPMFDSKGNVIGIVVAGVPGAENVGYAIKTSYLKILNESAAIEIKLPSNNTLSTLPLSEKVKQAKNYVYYIECSK